MKKNFNNEFNSKNIGETVTLYGWAQKTRNLGGLIFIDLRDRSGIIQLVISPENSYYEKASLVKNEYVLKVTGKIVERTNKNSNLKTGDIEVEVTSMDILNSSLDLPFLIDDDPNTKEETRLKYRYLDLRRNEIKDKLILRSKVCNIVRNYFAENDFVEVETPILCKATPEGARDYLVPSRVNKGSFYALPQSPQLFKQLLMVGGIERYYQIARCFRDEDLRADRQPEFTQIDMEMSFVDQKDIMKINEKLVARIFKEIKNIEISLPLKIMKYDDAIRDYGSDKPDLRYDMKIIDITNVFENTNFDLFKSSNRESKVINCLVVKDNASKFSRKDIDKLAEFVKTYKAQKLFYLKYSDSFSGSISSVLSDEEKSMLKSKLKLEDNDLVLIISDNYGVTKEALGALRCKLARDLGMIKTDDYSLLWVVDFPLFEYSEEEKRYVSCHHPFTACRDEDVDKLITHKKDCYSKAYDMVINGYEVGGGSIRIHDEKIQGKMFEALELTEEDIEKKFGFFVKALKYGVPPHGGLAFGLERLIMVLANTNNVKDVIAFPKTASASCLMSEAPDHVSLEQLQELGIKIVN